MTKRANIRLPELLLRRAKAKTAAEGRTLAALNEERLGRAVGESSPAGEQKERVMPRVSTARGGVKPGIDLNDSAALQEMDDLEHWARWK